MHTQKKNLNNEQCIMIKFIIPSAKLEHTSIWSLSRTSYNEKRKEKEKNNDVRNFHSSNSMYSSSTVRRQYKQMPMQLWSIILFYNPALGPLPSHSLLVVHVSHIKGYYTFMELTVVREV